MSKNSPLVSVCMITYNHENYIAEAIEGVLIQDVDFEVEFIIVDDCSTDQTRDIVQKFIDHHPKGKWIKYTRHQTNLGMMMNFIWALEACQGKYIALCEGDDYWSDPLKLQKQVDFLLSNPSFSIVYHPIRILVPNGDFVEDFIAEKYFKADESNIYDLALFGNYIHTPSVVFHKNCLSITENFYKSPVGDYFLYLILAQKGKIKRLDFIGAVYRKGSGIFSVLDLNERKYFRQLTLNLASIDLDIKLISWILKLRIHHNSLLGKVDNEIFSSSRINGFFSFYSYINKLELLKAIVKMVFYKKIKS